MSTRKNNMAYQYSAKRSNEGSATPNRMQKNKLIVDKDIGATKIHGIYESISEAIQAATSGTVIKITSNLYEEELIIKKPGMVLEPKEKGGEVTLQQRENPCIVVDVGADNVCTINNIRMLLKGPNKDANPKSFHVDMEFEKQANEKCMKEFFAHKPEDLYCIILLRSGILKMNGCTLSLDGIYRETYRKVPCMAALDGTRLEMNSCNIKGDTTNDADTAGILSMNADLNVQSTTLAHFKNGGIMVSAKPQNEVYIADNTLLSCDTAGIYIQGRASKPTIRGNKIAFCRCTAITTNLDVDANIFNNVITLNEMGIEIVNNKSRLIDNEIEKSHENGIKVTGNDNSTRATPLIWRNFIRTCGYNGIVGIGEQCEPDIRGNVITQNRKAGIKLTEKACAHIGGTTKVDIKFIPSSTKNNNHKGDTFQTAKVEAVKIFRNTEESFNRAGAEMHTPGRDGNTRDDLIINVKSFPNPNVIQSNYNQGILLVEGSYAKIYANKIDQNIKANIALGGHLSGMTKIKYNYIENSKSEGIFVVEGEEKLLIEDNQIVGNNDGIVLVNSLGIIKNNNIKANQRSGILTAAETYALVDSNFIEENLAAGILIKDPSLPELRRNEICKNFFQVQMEKHAKKKWTQYAKDNPKIIGNNEIPKSTCNIF